MTITLQFKFKIYAKIDGCYCYILWFYVRILTQIKISIYHQYFDVIHNISYISSII